MQGKRALPCVPLEQQAFFFVDQKERVEMARNYETQSNKRQRIVQINTRLLPEKVRVEVLEQPLFTQEGQRALRTYATDPLLAPDSGGSEEDDELNCSEKERVECIEYLADHALQFVGYVMDMALDALASIGNAKQKAFILEWMFAADILGVVIEEIESEDQDGQKTIVETTRTLFAVDEPFTFQWCCKLFGLRPDEWQTQVLRSLERAEKETLIRENNGEVKSGRHKTYQDALALAKSLH